MNEQDTVRRAYQQTGQELYGNDTKAVNDYVTNMMAQYAKAHPDLQKAIDAIHAQVVELHLIDAAVVQLGPDLVTSMLLGERAMEAASRRAQTLAGDLRAVSDAGASIVIPGPAGIGAVHRAEGGMTQGYAVVGERGPELAYFGSPANIVPNDVAFGAFGGGGGGGFHVGVVNITVPDAGSPRATALAVRDELLNLKAQTGITIGLG